MKRGTITFSQKVVKAYDLRAKKPVQGTITMSAPNAPFELNITHVGKLAVIGKDDPLVFAVDVVVNALNKHLSTLQSDAPLNAPSSIADWALSDRVWGVMDGMAEDLY
jgi:hypothetical protein